MNRFSLSMLATAVMCTATFASSGWAETAPIKSATSAALLTGATFLPPDQAKIPDDEFGKMVQLGRNIMYDTKKYAPQYVGNALNCVNCHTDGGAMAGSAPLWGAWVSYPAYRSKNKKVNTFEDRLQGCFMYSMNG